MAQAERLRNEGKLSEAALLYRNVAEGKTDHAPEAIKAVNDMLDSPDLQANGAAAEMAGVFRVAWDLRNRPGAPKDLFKRGLHFIEARAEEQPAGCLAVLEAVEPETTETDRVVAEKQKLLERLVRDKPDDIDLLCKLAVVYEHNNQRERCLALLEPHVKQLGITEGARILGLIYYSKGKQDEALALLQPYADQRLQQANEVAKQVQAAWLNARTQVFNELKSGKAQGFDFEHHKNLPEAQGIAMVEEYVTSRLKDDPALARQLEELGRQHNVVEVAIDLGTMRLTRAQRLVNPNERKAELQKAEKTFLSVRDLAGDNAEYQLSLGQVYYWLGKQADGKKLFDQVLQTNGRSLEALRGVASLYRELGAMTEAHHLLEEAYKKPGINTALQQDVAMLRAITPKDLDDQILWLDRANPAMPDVKAGLADARGRKASREGKDDEAAVHFRESINVWKAQTEDSTSLNNGGLAWLSLYDVTGDREALAQGSHMLEKAVTLKPGDGILVVNAANAALGVALGEIIGERIDFRKLRRQASVGDLYYLYRDKEGRDGLVQQAKASAAIARAHTHLDRALILAPNSRGIYAAYSGLLYFLGDREGLAGLDRRAADAKIDLTDIRKENLDTWSGKDNEKHRLEANFSATRAKQKVADARATGGATFALAVASLIGARIAQEVLGIEIDPEELVRLAEEANQLAPSEGTRSILQTALLERANKALALKDRDYGALANRGRRTLNASYVVAVALWREDKSSAAVLANPDVKRVQEMVRADTQRFPDSPSEWEWIMLRTAYAEDAKGVAEALNKNELLQISRSLAKHLSPLTPTSALQECWALEAEGKAKGGRDVLKRCAAEAVPLPFDLP